MYNVNMPSYGSGSEDSPLVPKDGRPRTMGNLVETGMESTQALPEGRTVHHTSNFATMMHLLKGNIGTGILAMPTAISNAGLTLGTVGIPILGIFCIHCMHLLVKNSKRLAARKGCTSLDYSSTAEQAFLTGPPALVRFAPYVRRYVDFMLMLTQFGFCCVYFLFVAKSIGEVVVSLAGDCPLSQIQIMALILPLMILFNMIRSLQSLSPASAIANVLQIIGLTVVLYYILPGPYSNELNVYTTDIEKLPLYFGTAMYAFEGIGVVLPLENEMATPADFRGLNGVLNTGMTIVACLYTGVGFFGYLKYGKDVKSSITFNLPKGVVSEIVRLMFAIAIFLSYALQLYVPITMIWPSLKRRFNIERYSERKQLYIEYGFRASLVFFTFVLACVIPLLHLFISLVGALASSSLALILPPMINIAVVWNDPITLTWFILILAKDCFLIVFGIFGSIVGTYVTIQEISVCLGNMTLPSCQV